MLWVYTFRCSLNGPPLAYFIVRQATSDNMIWLLNEKFNSIVCARQSPWMVQFIQWKNTICIDVPKLRFPHLQLTDPMKSPKHFVCHIVRYLNAAMMWMLGTPTTRSRITKIKINVWNSLTLRNSICRVARLDHLIRLRLWLNMHHHLNGDHSVISTAANRWHKPSEYV